MDNKKNRSNKGRSVEKKITEKSGKGISKGVEATNIAPLRKPKSGKNKK